MNHNLIINWHKEYQAGFDYARPRFLKRSKCPGQE